MIYRVWGGFCISSRGCWLPGVYESERAARYAYRFHWRDLQLLQRKANRRRNRTITMDDLRAERRRIRDGGR